MITLWTGISDLSSYFITILSKLKEKYINLLSFTIVILPYAVICYKLLFANNNITLLGDTLAPYFPVEANIDYFISAWHPRYFGLPGNAPIIHVLMYVFLKLCGDAALVQKIVGIFLPIMIAPIGMYIFLLKSGLVKSWWAQVACSIIYGINWITLAQLGATSLTFIYAAVPLVLLFLFRICMTKNKVLYNSIGLALSLTLATVISTQAPAILFPILLPLIAAFILLKASEKGVLDTFRELRRISSALCLAFLFYALLILPVSAHYARLFIDSGWYATALAPKSSYVSVAQNPSWYSGLFPYLFSPLLVLSSPSPASFLDFLGFFTPFLMAIPIFSKNRVKRVLSISLITTVLVVVMIIHLIIVGSPITDILYNRFQFPFLAYMEPWKYCFLLAPMLSVLTAFGLDEITCYLSNIQKEKKLYRAIKPGIVAILVIMALTTAMLSRNSMFLSIESVITPREIYSEQGDVTTARVPRGHYVPSYLPQYIIELCDMFNARREKEGPFRILWVPSEFYVQRYVGRGDLSGILFPPRNEALCNHLIDIIKQMRKGKISTLGATLAPLNIKYIVVLKTINQTSPIGIWYAGRIPQFIIGKPSDFIELLEKQDDLSLLAGYDEPEYMIFKNDYPTSRVSLASNDDYAEVHFLEQEPEYSPSRFVVEVNTSKPVDLVLSEAYDQSWKAYAIDKNGDKHELCHFEVIGWANGFHLDCAGLYKVEIVSERQEFVTLIIRLWMIFSIILIAAFAALSLGYTCKLQNILDKVTVKVRLRA